MKTSGERDEPRGTPVDREGFALRGHGGRRRTLRDRNGFALMGALWLVVILAVVGLELALETKAATRRVSAVRDHSVARSAAEGGVAYARELLAARLEQVAGGGGETGTVDPWREPNRLVRDTLVVGEARVVIRLEDAGTRLNLNRASEVELRRLMTALRMDDGQADRLAQAILDWRDLDDHRRARGAEAAEYEAAGSLRSPANGAFASVDQLRHVLGMTPEVCAQISPFLGVDGSGRINLAAAPEEVLWAVPGMTRALLARILRERRTVDGAHRLLSTLSELEPSQVGLDRAGLAAVISRVSVETEEVLIVSEGWVPGSPVRAAASALAVKTRSGPLLVEVGQQ